MNQTISKLGRHLGHDKSWLFLFSVCASCKPGVSKCPTCRLSSRLDVHNIAVEKIFNALVAVNPYAIPCQFNCETEVGFKKLQIHEEYCNFRNIRCFQTNKAKCNFFGKVTKFLEEHVKDGNCFNVVVDTSKDPEPNKSSFQVSIMDMECPCTSSRECEHSVFKCKDDLIFRPVILLSRREANSAFVMLFVTRTVAGLWYMSIAINGSDSIRRKFTIEMTIKRPANKKTSIECLPSYSYKGFPDVYRWTHQEMIAGGATLILTDRQLQKLSHHNELCTIMVDLEVESEHHEELTAIKSGFSSETIDKFSIGKKLYPSIL